MRNHFKTLCCINISLYCPPPASKKHYDVWFDSMSSSVDFVCSMSQHRFENLHTKCSKIFAYCDNEFNAVCNHAKIICFEIFHLKRLRQSWIYSLLETSDDRLWRSLKTLLLLNNFDCSKQIFSIFGMRKFKLILQTRAYHETSSERCNFDKWMKFILL